MSVITAKLLFLIYIKNKVKILAIFIINKIIYIPNQ
jgi:hypothetical protein